jgi:predicted nucleic acid-binding protein
LRPAALYLDTSAILRVLLEAGSTPEIEQRLQAARILVTSRLSQVEAARALLRHRQMATTSDARLAAASRDLDALWARCELWELTPRICEAAAQIAPGKPLRTLDALHLATYLLARREIEGLELLATDQRLSEAASAV